MGGEGVMGDTVLEVYMCVLRGREGGDGRGEEEECCVKGVHVLGGNRRVKLVGWEGGGVRGV